MTSSQITKFQLAMDALGTAIQKEYEFAINYFDAQVQQTFQDILAATPTSEGCRVQLCRFLLDHCCENDDKTSTIYQAKQKLSELL